MVTAYRKTARTGGGANALDGIDGNVLKDGDFAFVFDTGAFYVYILDADSGAPEDDPDVIAPDVNPGDKRWVLQVSYLATGVAREWTAAQTYDAQTVSSASNHVSWDVSAKPLAKLAMTENTTIDAPINQSDGGWYALIITHDGSSTVSWANVFKFAGGNAPALSSASGAVDILTFESDGANMRCTGYVLDVK